MRTYDDELTGYPDIYAAALAGDDSPYRDAADLLRGRYVYAIGSGGALPAAILAVELHRANGGRGEALSPLAFVDRISNAEDAVVVVFSARAKHPDTAFAVKHATARDIPVLLITQRTSAELAEPFTSPLCLVITVPSPNGPDGFLATQSIVAMIVASARIFNIELPSALDWNSPTGGDEIRDRLLVLYGPRDSAAAHDAEVRFNELGVSDVQLVDYRNFAHGRHVGLTRHLADTTILLLVSPSSAGIAQLTAAKLPAGLDQLWLRTEQPGLAGTLELLSGTSHLLAQKAKQVQLNAHKPRVAPFGRELYHLAFNRLYPVVRANPVSRKLAQMAVPDTDAATAAFYAKSYKAWRNTTNKVQFGAVLLDYDGTCVETTDRWDPPIGEVQEQVVRLLSEGTVVGFASGRGDSLYLGLRSWIPETYWPMVRLGLHNGSWRLTLNDDATEVTTEPLWSAELTARLSDLIEIGIVSARVNSHQVSFGSSRIPIRELHALVESIVRRMPSLPLSVAASGHSVDVIDANSGKAQFLNWLQAELETQILVIGDQGNLGGNDFAMLAATPHSLSVDRCSADPTRCWNISASGNRGPSATAEILAGMAKRSRGHALNIPKLESR